MSEKQQPYLYVVRPAPSDPSSPSDGAQTDVSVDGQPAAPRMAGESCDAAADDSALASDGPLNQPLQQAIMYAAVSWVALCMERSAYSVDIQPIASRLYEVSVHYADGDRAADAGSDAVGGIILRVRLAVEPGLVLRTVVEPVRP